MDNPTAQVMESIEALRSIFDGAAIAVCICRDEIKLMVNPAFIRLFGFSDPGELMGLPCLKHVAPQCRDLLKEQRSRIREGSAMSAAFEIAGLRQDGYQVPLFVHLSPVTLSDGPAELMLMTDVSEYKNAQARLEHLASFPRLATIPIMEINYGGEVLFQNDAVRQTLDAIGVTEGNVFIPTDLENILYTLELTNRGSFSRELTLKGRIFSEEIFLAREFRTLRIYIYDATERIHAQQELKASEENYRDLILNLGDGVSIVDLREIFTFANPAMDAIFGLPPGQLVGHRISEFVSDESMVEIRRQTEKRSRGERSSYEIEITTPAGQHRQILVSATPKYQNDDFIGTLSIVRDITDRRLAVEELTRSYTRLNRAMDQTINALATTLGKRDPYTSTHQRRVTQLVLAIARELGLPEAQVAGIRVASILHDIGKIYIPSEILAKPTKLTEVEFDIIKNHSLAGYEILQGIEFPWPVAEIVHQHHERLDGSGYPQGLGGDQILLEAKILSVADVVEAISSDRPYRPAHSIETALDEITNFQGRYYAPDVVAVCLDLFKNKQFTFA